MRMVKHTRTPDAPASNARRPPLVLVGAPADSTPMIPSNLPRAALLAGLCGLTLLGCDRTGPPVRIGLLPYLSGQRAEISGRATVDAAELAVEEANLAGGIRIAGRRHPVRLAIADAGVQVQVAAGATRSLINNDSVVAIVGPQFSRDAVGVAGLANQAGIPMIAPMASEPSVTRDRPFVFRIAYTDDVQGRAMATFARERLGAARAALLYDVTDDYARGLASVFRDRFIELGGTIAAEETFTQDAPDYRAGLRRIAQSRPDVLFLPSYVNQVGPQMVEARQLGIEAVFLGTDVWNGTTISGIPEAAGSVQTIQWWPDSTNPVARAFIDRFTDRYGRTPSGTEAATWDAMQVLFAAMEAAGSTEGPQVRDALSQLVHDGVTGRLTFVGAGDPDREPTFIRLGPEGPRLIERAWRP